MIFVAVVVVVAHEILKTAQSPLSLFGFDSYGFGAWTLDWDLDSGLSITFFVAIIFAERRLFLDNEYFNIRLGFRVNVAFSDTRSFKL